MYKHTPGPWRFDQTWALIYGPKKEEIAAVHAAQDGTRRVHPQTAHANARLIAAAPSLLEALEAFWTLCLNDSVRDAYHGKASFDDLMDSTEALITQARGES